MLDYYRILSVPSDAPQEALKAAYIKRLKQFHPDIYRGADATAKTQKINEAYQTLKDLDKRAAYDRRWKAAYGGSRNPSADEFAESPEPANGGSGAYPGYGSGYGSGASSAYGRAHPDGTSSDADILAFATGNFSRRRAELKQRIEMLCAAMMMDLAQMKAAAETPQDLERLREAARREFGAHKRDLLEENQTYYQGLLHSGLKPTTIMIVDGLKQTQENFIIKSMDNILPQILAGIGGESSSAWGYNRSNDFGSAAPGGDLQSWGSFWWGFGLSLFMPGLILIFALARLFFSQPADAQTKRSQVLYLLGSVAGSLISTLFIQRI